MTLIDTAMNLLIRLEAASTEDSGDELLSRAQIVREDIVSATEHFERVLAYRESIDRTDAPPFDAKAVRQAVGRFRGALSRSGPKAFQQQSAATLEGVLRAQTTRVDRWVASTWRENFDDSRSLQERANSDDLYGSPALKARAKARAARLAVLRNQDPVRNRKELEDLLQAQDLKAMFAQVGEIVEELRGALETIDSEHAAMTPEVRSVLEGATSGDGLPLVDVTPDLMEALRAAGVLDDLVVRRL